MSSDSYNKVINFSTAPNRILLSEREAVEVSKDLYLVKKAPREGEYKTITVNKGDLVYYPSKEKLVLLKVSGDYIELITCNFQNNYSATTHKNNLKPYFPTDIQEAIYCQVEDWGLNDFINAYPKDESLEYADKTTYEFDNMRFEQVGEDYKGLYRIYTLENGRKKSRKGYIWLTQEFVESITK